MTGPRLVALVARALRRPGTTDELTDWAAVLEHVRDDDADAGLLTHRAVSHNPPTPADVRRAAASIANDRHHRAELEARRLEQETGRTADGQPLVPMPPHVREGFRDLAARQRVRELAVDSAPIPTEETA